MNRPMTAYEQKVQTEMARMHRAYDDLLRLAGHLNLINVGCPAKVEAIQRLWPQAVFEEQEDGRVTAVVNVPLGRRTNQAGV